MTNYELLAGFLPEPTLSHQVAWERRAQVLRAWRAGAMQKDIAHKMGVSVKRVNQMALRAYRIDRLKPSPAEVYQRLSRAIALPTNRPRC